MAKVKIQGHASGTGVLTVTAPNTSTDRTITLPDATGTLLNSDGDGSNLTGLSSFDPDGAVVINESGADVDFRVESNGNANMLVVDGGNNKVGIGHAAPEGMIDIHFSNTTAPTGVNSPTASAIQIHNTGGANAISAITFTGADHSGDACLASIYAKHTNVTENQEATSLHFLTSHSESDVNALEITSDGRGLSQFTAKAWGRWNGTGTLAVADSHNASSVTDNSVGNYSLNFSNNMANTNYCGIAGSRWSQGQAGTYSSYMYVGSCKVGTGDHAGTDTDQDTVTLIVFGD